MEKNRISNDEYLKLLESAHTLLKLCLPTVKNPIVIEAIKIC